MRRADRLFRLLLQLRRGRVVTARSLAERLEVSERTVYRDIADLASSGVPITGEAGVGYQLRGFDLPPLMFDREEVEAMVLGARVVEAWGDQRLARSAAEALAKIEAALPRSLSPMIEETPLYVPTWGERLAERLPLSAMRQAIHQHRVIELSYRDEHGRETERRLRPLALAFHPPAWLLLAWCELRGDFRAFRLDRFQSFEVLPELFKPEPGKTLEDFHSRMERERAQSSA
ncbi:MAG TPA: YafY family protein [Thermoanaerobaculia bacterium]|nr:YafY family protein [Thermoanaerobaculia bacterium]